MPGIRTGGEQHINSLTGDLATIDRWIEEGCEWGRPISHEAFLQVKAEEEISEMEKFKSIDEVREYFSGDKFATEAAGIEIVEARAQYAKCRFRVEDVHLNAANVVMGGAIYTLADLTFAVAANSEGVHTVTASSNISFLAPATGKELYAEAKPIKEGRTICLYEVRVYDETDRNVAYATMTGAHVG